MKKMMEQHRKFMKNNKGFSLVELIIVIAIMAVLVAVLAPQYTKYVEKSRESTDISAVDSIVGACKTVAIDPNTYDQANAAGFTVTWAKNGNISVTAGDNTAKVLNAAIQDLVGQNVAPKSKACIAEDTKVTISATGNVTVEGGILRATTLGGTSTTDGTSKWNTSSTVTTA